MKKFALIALALVFCMVFAACNGTNKKSNTNDTSASVFLSKHALYTGDSFDANVLKYTPVAGDYLCIVTGTFPPTVMKESEILWKEDLSDGHTKCSIDLTGFEALSYVVCLCDSNGNTIAYGTITVSDDTTGTKSQHT